MSKRIQQGHLKLIDIPGEGPLDVITRWGFQANDDIGSIVELEPGDYIYVYDSKGNVEWRSEIDYEFYSSIANPFLVLNTSSGCWHDRFQKNIERSRWYEFFTSEREAELEYEAP
jgi:hypothetical protein